MIRNYFRQFPNEFVPRCIALGLLLILMLMPLHGFLATWIGSSLDNIEPAKVWKESILVFLALITAADMWRHPLQRKQFFASRINQLIGLYVILHIGAALVYQPPLQAVAVALTLNLRFLGIFTLGRWMMVRTRKTAFVTTIMKVVGVSIAVIVAFGLGLERKISDETWMKFGYGSDTLPPSYTLDDNSSIIRLASTTRGPNVFAQLIAGATLPVYLSGMHLVLKTKYTDSQLTLKVLATALLIVALYLTYSRSGLVTLFVGIGVLTALLVPAAFRLRAAVGTVIIGLSIVLLLTQGALSSSFLSTVILHDDPNSGGSETSTSKRFEANSIAFAEVVEAPFGEGPGTAGPASFYNDSETRIAENYYLQIAQEVGIIGAVLFIAIVVLVARRLYMQRSEFWPKVLLAFLIGASIAGLFVHIWADGEVALLFWGIAGMFLKDD